MHYTVESHSPHLNQQVIGVSIKNNHMALLLLTTKTKYFKPQNRKLKYDYFFVTGNSSYMALNNLYCQHMIPGSKVPNYDTYGLLRTSYSHNPAKYSHIVVLTPHF